MAENPFESPQVDEAPVEANGPAGYELAGRGTRLVAVIVDGILLTVATLPFAYYFQFGFFQPALPPDVEVNPFNPWSAYAAVGAGKAALSTVLGVVVYFALNGYLLNTNGQTLGKRLLGVKIVRKSGAAAEFHRLALHRYLLLTVIYLVPVVGMIFAILDPLMIFRRSRYCLHDDIADTVVVRDLA